MILFYYHIMNLVSIMTAAFALTSATPDIQADNSIPVIGKNQITLTNDRLTPEALWAMGRIGAVAVSPDAQHIAYTVSYYSVEQNKSHTVIYCMNSDGSNNVPLTKGKHNESQPSFSADGKKSHS